MSLGRISDSYMSLKRGRIWAVGAAISLLELLARFTREAHAATVVAALDAEPRGVAGLRVEHHHVGDVDGAFLLDHAAGGLALALGVAQRARALMALLAVHPLHE